MRNRPIKILLLMLSIASTSTCQLLEGDENFPIIRELRWGMSTGEVRTLCEERKVVVTSTDSSIVIATPVLGFGSRMDLHFDDHGKTLTRVQAKLNQPTKSVTDSIISYLSRKVGTDPVRTVKEKSVLFITLRMEVASWKLATGLVNVITAMRGNSMLDASILLIPPTKRQNPGSQ